MKKEKSYDIKDSYLRELYLSIKKELNPNRDSDLIRLTSFIQRMKIYSEIISNRRIEEKEIIKIFQDDLGGIEFYKPFYPYAKCFANHGFLYTKDINYRKVRISNQEAMQGAEDFFNIQGSFYVEAFQEFKEEATTHLKFMRLNSLSNGEMTYLTSKEEAFVLVPNKSNILKQVILIHELEHVIEIFNNDDYFNNKVIGECGALFMEMIACDYFAKKLNLKSDNLWRRLDLHNNIKLASGDLLNRFMILHNLKFKGDNTDIFDVYRYDYLDYLAKSSLEYDFSYPISYLIAIELYVIYQENKDKALNYLQYIIMLGNDENILDLLDYLGIDINRNALYYEKRLCKELGI